MEASTVSSVNQSSHFYDMGDFLRTYEEEQNALNMTRTIFITIYAILAIISVLADLIIAFVTLKYKKLRSENSNKIILNFVITDALLMILLPVGVAFVHDIMFQALLGCVIIIAIDCVLFAGTILIIVLLTVYWYIKLYHPDSMGRFNENVTKRVLICLYIVLVLFLPLFVMVYVQAYLILLIFAACIFIVIIDVVHIIAKRKLVDYKLSKDSTFWLSNIFFLSKLPYSLYILSIVTAYSLPIDNVFFMAAIYLLGIISVINGIYFFIILYHCDKNYNTFLRSVLGCWCSRTDTEIGDRPVRYAEGEDLMGNGR